MVEEGSKISVRKIQKDLYMIRVEDRLIKYFEGLWEIPEGVTYNSYVLIGNEGSVLFDTVGRNFSNMFIDTLRSLIDIKDIKFIITQHLEPDHSGALPELLKELNHLTEVLGHPLASKLIESLYGLKPRFRSVGDGEVIEFGEYKLMFIYVPWLHWPETILTYVGGNLNYLMTCDVFGAYSIPEYFEIDVNYLPKEYEYFMRKYFVNVIGYYRENVIKNLSKLKQLNLRIEAIAPAHGSILKGKEVLERVSNLYESWAKAEASDNKVTIVYTSMYGYVEKVIEYLVKALSERGVNTSVFKFTSYERSNVSDLLGEVLNSKMLIIASATYDADLFPLMTYILELILKKTNAEKPLVLLTVYGWGNAASNKAKELISKSKYRIVGSYGINSLVKDKDYVELNNLIKKILELVRG